MFKSLQNRLPVLSITKIHIKCLASSRVIHRKAITTKLRDVSSKHLIDYLHSTLGAEGLDVSHCDAADDDASHSHAAVVRRFRRCSQEWIHPKQGD